jgi:hypothetical protein
VIMPGLAPGGPPFPMHSERVRSRTRDGRLASEFQRFGSSNMGTGDPGPIARR